MLCSAKGSRSKSLLSSRSWARLDPAPPSPTRCLRCPEHVSANAEGATMGTEITGEAKYRRGKYRVSLHLDSKTLELRDELKLKIPLKDVRQAVAKDGQLAIAWNDEKIVLEVGAQSERLAKKILNPPSLLDKLGIKPKSTVSVVGLDDPAFLKDLRAHAGSVSEGKAKPQSDILIVRIDARKNLER